MGFYLERENYARQLATSDEEIQHAAPLPKEDWDFQHYRQSFFRINNDEELLEASVSWIHFPCLVMASITGNQISKAGSIRQANHNAWLVLAKAIEREEESGKGDAISRAYDQTFETLLRLKDKIIEDFEEGCGLNIEETTFKWEQVGPVGDQLYGWSFTFSDELKKRY